MKMKIKIIILFLIFILCFKYNILYIMNFDDKINNLKIQIDNYNNYNNYTDNNDNYDILKNKYLNKIINKINNLNNFFHTDFNTNLNTIVGGKHLKYNPLHPLFLETINKKDKVLLSKILFLYDKLKQFDSKNNTQINDSISLTQNKEKPTIIKLVPTIPIISPFTPPILSSIRSPIMPPIIKIVNKSKLKTNIKIFNWNICWQCVAGEQKGSAAELGKLCHPDKCFNNIKKILNQLTNFDFITLQEAYKWNDLTQNLQHTHGIVNSKSGREDMVTLYNKKKFIVKEFTFGDISNTGGRPFQIIIFELVSNSSDIIILINLHNGHNIKKSDVEQKISYAFNKLKNINQLQGSNIYVIAAGDFNDTGEKYYNNFQPFKYSSFNQFKNIDVTSKTKTPPNTCCSVKEPPKTIYSRYGDYILFSGNFNIKQNNLIYQINNSNKVLASDHLAIYSELEIN